MKIALVALSLNEFPPLALGYLKAAALNDSELKDILEFFIYDEAIDDYTKNPEKKDMLVSNLVKKNPDIILFSCYLWNTRQMLELGSTLKKKSNAKIILGGPAVTYDAEAVLEKNPSVDIVIRGEAEITFVELLKELMKCQKPPFAISPLQLGVRRRFLSMLKNTSRASARVFLTNDSLQNIAGITYRKDGKTINTKPRALITNLDDIPSPYLIGNLEVNEKALIETHRGCFFRCGYCLEYKSGPIREFSVDRTRQEIKYVVEHGARKITLCNSIFNNSLERATELCNMLHEFKEYNLEINVDSYAEWLTKEMVDLYVYGGITGTEIGLQSINANVLRNIRRPSLNKEKFKEKIRMLDSAGIKTCLHVILGLPDETLSSFQETAKYAFSTEPTDISFFKLLMMPGTELQRFSEKFGIKYNPEPPYEVISTPTMSSEDIKRAELFVKKAYREFILKSPNKIS